MNFDNFIKTLEIEPDEDQKRAIKSLENVVVTAGAGSGKTTVLSYRFLYLVLEKKARVDQILTLTFTKKAAAEMKGRIYQRLLDANLDSASLELFDKSSIQTIDSFLSMIVRRGCYDYDIPSDFTTDDAENSNYDEEAKKMLNEYFKEDSKYYQGLKLLLNLYRNDEVDDILSYIASSCSMVVDAPDIILNFNKYEKFLIDEIDKEEIELLNIISEAVEDIRAQDKQNKAKEQSVQTLIRAHKQLLGKKRRDNNLDAYNIFNELKTAGFANNTYKEDIMRQVDKSRSIYEDYNNLQAIRNLMLFFDEYQKRIISLKRESGVLSFDDISNLANRILLDKQEVREYFFNNYKYIMIDEFQDNNMMQKNILFLLSTKKKGMLKEIKVEDIEKDRLFFVGDSKQSIYGFRGADIRAFNSLSKGGFKEIVIGNNYRSHANLIKKFNEIFPKVLTYKDEYSAIFDSLIKTPKKEDDKERVEIFIGDANLGKDQEALKVLSLIKEKLKEGYTYNDMAVLFASSSRQNQFERVFSLNNIPYISDSLKDFFNSTLLNDFYYLLQYYLYKNDKIALLSTLRSPFIREKNENLDKIINGDEENERLNKILLDIRSHLLNNSLSSLIHYLYHQTGYKYYAMLNSYSSFENYYNFFYALAISFDKENKSLEDLLGYLRPILRESINPKEINFISENLHGITLSTIHKSKGLEYKIVFFVNVNNIDRKHPVKAIVKDDENNFLFSFSKTNYFIQQYNDLKEKQKSQEKKRLLYVALTRAVDYLYIIGDATFSAKAPRIVSTGYANLIDIEYLYENIKVFKENREEIRKELKDINLKKEVIMDTPYDYSSSYINASSKDEHIEIVKGAKSLKLYKEDEGIKKENLQANAGSLIHNIIHLYLNKETLDFDDAFENSYEKSTIKDIHRSLIYSFTRNLFDNFISDKSLQKAINEATQIYSEYSYTFANEKDLYHASIDLILEYEDEVWVIDFKTDSHFSPIIHLSQLNLYKDLCSFKFKKPVKSFLYYLRDGLLHQLD